METFSGWSLTDPTVIVEYNTIRYKDFANDSGCDDIINSCSLLETFDATIVNHEIVVNNDVRKSKIKWIPTTEEYAWIYRACTDAITSINDKFYKYDLSYIEPLQFTEYNSDNSFYGKHIDLLTNQNLIRKLSFTVQLSKPTDYVGGDLVMYNKSKGLTAVRDRGTITFFNSMTLHEVMPVTEGTRYSLVGWVCGPRWR